MLLILYATYSDACLKCSRASLILDPFSRHVINQFHEVIGNTALTAFFLQFG